MPQNSSLTVCAADSEGYQRPGGEMGLGDRDRSH
jgi:hypothetical protein